MRVLLKLVLDCDAETAWRVIRSPAGMTQVSAPFMSFESLEPGGFPQVWPVGDHPVRASALGVVPMGDQLIAIGRPPERNGFRLVRDSGGGLSGALAVIRFWQHTMAVAPRSDGRTEYRDQLRFGAGILTLPMWPVYWAFWQWRGIRMRRLARTW